MNGLGTFNQIRKSQIKNAQSATLKIQGCVEPETAYKNLD